MNEPPLTPDEIIDLSKMVTDLQRQIADTQRAWRKDGLRMQREIEQYRLALRYIAGEAIPGWDDAGSAEDVAKDALIGAPNIASAEQ